MVINWLCNAMRGRTKMPEGLDESTLAAIGQTLYAEACYGWGWSFEENMDQQQQTACYAGFHFILHDLWDYEGKRRGGTGIINEATHPLNGQWVVFSTRHAGTYNFKAKRGYFNISVGKEKPIANKRGWPTGGQTSVHQGFGTIYVLESGTKRN